LVKDGSQILGLDVGYAVLIIVVLFLFRVVIGAASGWIGWDLGHLVERRLARSWQDPETV
jgi:hypothetical protein